MMQKITGATLKKQNVEDLNFILYMRRIME